MNFFHAIILGIVEGLTEFLPISSTAHLIIANKLLALPENEFIKSFDIYIQLGAILAVVVLYAKRLLANIKLLIKVAVAFVPTAIIGLIAYPFVKQYLLASLSVCAWALLIGGIILILFEKFYKTKKTEVDINYSKAVGIGLFQALAIIPGTSRAAATIIGGLKLGIDKKSIVEFSFLLAIPTMAAATGLDLIKTGFAFNGVEWQLLGVGFIVSFLTALLAIRFFLKYIQNHSFTAFGWYRIIIGAIILLITYL